MEATTQTMDPTPLNNKLGLPTIVIERFLSMVDRNHESGCWIWTGSFGTTGYGQYRFGPQGDAPWKAHRLSYALTYGEIPERHHIHHLCNEPRCVRPEHLQAVTPREHIVNLTPGSGSYIASRKTHCINGHEFSPENTHIRTDNGKRECIACRRATSNASHHKFRAANPLPEKTHCIKGHPLSGDNLVPYTTSKGAPGRGCKACRTAATVAYQKRNWGMILDKAKAYSRAHPRKKKK